MGNKYYRNAGLLSSAEKERIMKKRVLFLMVTCMVWGLCACGKKEPVKIASKPMTEQYILMPHCQSVSIRKSVQSCPCQTKPVIFCNKLFIQLLIIFLHLLFLQNIQPCCSGILRIKIKITLNQRRMDIGRAAAHAFCDFHSIICLSLNQLRNQENWSLAAILITLS